jgi:hypothetical protein
MQCDYSVDLGPDAPALELPWSSEDGSKRYFDLKRNPELVLDVAEARGHPVLSEFLSRINAPDFPLQTAKCDVWPSRELLPEEEIFGAACKFVSYVDLLFSGAGPRTSFEQHEALAQDICNLLKRAPEMAAAAEFVIRRCYYHSNDGAQNSVDGFCITAYVTGFGDTEEEALQRWGIALKLLQHALVQQAFIHPDRHSKIPTGGRDP